MRGTTSNENLAPGANFPTVFNYGSSKLRTIKKNDQTWFVLTDVCKALTLTDAKKTAESLDEDEKAVGVILHPQKNGATKAWIINESGLYHLIFISRKPEARAFRKWVTSEVLPALRTQGSYEVQRADVESNRPAANKDLVNGMFALADNIGRVGNNYRRTALLREFKKIKKCLSL